MEKRIAAMEKNIRALLKGQQTKLMKIQKAQTEFIMILENQAQAGGAPGARRSILGPRLP